MDLLVARVQLALAAWRELLVQLVPVGLSDRLVLLDPQEAWVLRDLLEGQATPE